MKNKGSFYTYNKFIVIAIILIIVVSYLLLYFYPSLKEIREKKQKLKAHISQIEQFKREIENFQPPDEKERLLWKKIDSLTEKTYRGIKTKGDFLKYVNSIILSLNSILSSRYNDFLVNIEDKNIKLTQTLKKESNLLSVFKTVNEYHSVTKGMENNSNTFKAFDIAVGTPKEKDMNDFKVKIFLISNLRKSSSLLIELYKNLKNFTIEKIVIRRKDNKTYNLFILNFRIKRLYKNA